MTLAHDLNALKSWADEVIVVGDGFDLMRPRRPRQWRAHLRACQAAYPQLYDALMSCQYVFGNHDEHLKALNIPEEWAFEGAGVSILATHGHQGDQWIKRVPGLAEAGNFAAGWFERMHVPGLANALGHVPEMVDRLKPFNASSTDNDRAHTLADALLAQGWDIVVMGHSHALDAIPIKQSLFLNTGSHACGFRDYVLLDTSIMHAQCVRDGAVFRQAALTDQGWSCDLDSPCDAWVAFAPLHPFVSSI